jgi:hypothetical protein
MSNPSNNEQRLTAFFDGELSGEERAAVEQLLSENSEYRQLLDDWRRSGDRLRALPSYRLDERFASRVMQEIGLIDHAATLPASTLASHWRIGFAAIATLAAMLLLTLFVFPNLNDPGSLALKTAGEAAESFSPVTDGLVFKNGPTGGQPTEVRDETNIADSPLPAESGLGSKKTPLPIAPKDSARQLAQFQIANPNSDNAVPRPQGGVVRSEQDFGTAGIGGGALGANLKRGAGLDASEMLVENTPRGVARRPKGGFSGTPAQLSAPSSPLGMAELEAEMSKTESSDVAFGENENRVTVEQVLIIDMPDETQPMAVINDVFFRNRIEVVTPEMGAGNANQFQSGIEALYVVSTPSQMQQAVWELSDQANIAGYQIPQRVILSSPTLSKQSMPKQSMPNQAIAQERQSAAGAIAGDAAAGEQPESEFSDQSPLRESDSELVRGKDLESPFEGSQFRGVEPSDLRAQPLKSSAQQLQPYSLGVNQADARFSAKSGYQVEEGKLFFKNQSDAELDGQGLNGSLGDPSSSELIRYLLFVRTSRKVPSDAEQAGSIIEPEASFEPEK